MGQFDDILERYEQALVSEHALRQERQAAIVSDDLDRVREISKKLIVAQKLRRQLQAAVAELETLETAKSSGFRSSTIRQRVQFILLHNRMRFQSTSRAAAAVIIFLFVIAAIGFGIAVGIITLRISINSPSPTITALPTATDVVLIPDYSISVLSTPVGEVLRVQVDTANPPFSFLDKDTGEVEGLDVDILGEICQRYGCIPKFIQLSTNSFDSLFDGSVSIATGLAYSDNTTGPVYYSTPYYQITYSLFVRANDFRFSNLDEFEAGNYRIGVQAGTDKATAAYDFGYGEHVGFNTLDAALEALVTGDVDGLLVNEFTSPPGSVAKLADGLVPQELSIGLSSDDQFLFVNEALEEMREDGTLDALIAKWIPSVNSSG